MFSPPNYSAPESFLDPKFGPWTVPLYLHRKPILDSVREASPVLKGKLLDVGCGDKPYASLLSCSRHVGLDIASSPHCKSNFDATYDGVVLPFGDAEFDSALCTEVLEHCRDPQRVVQEMWRVLKPGGYALVTVPMVIHHHEEPWDFQRFTWYGMKELAKQSGFQLVWLRPRGNIYSAGLGVFYTVLGYTLSKRPVIDVLLWLFWPVALVFMWCDKKAGNDPPPMSLGWQMLVQKPYISLSGET
jgi:SAM-dependent methyltransferase